jgi:hypothetical protein
MIPLRCFGVARDKDNISTLQFYFTRPVTNDEMRFLGEVMQRAAACIPKSASRDADQSRGGKP